MPTHAFFLCNDEKALEAVSQVLNELAVSFDLFKEPSVAVKRLASQHFDMILVDCDNEQTAAQLLSSAKNSSVNQGTISIAIVDGKSGVANAFRLGAGLVLSKPVSIEQARGTVRNALAMVRKSSPEAKNVAHGGATQTAPTPAVATPAASSPPVLMSLQQTATDAVPPVIEPPPAVVVETPAPRLPNTRSKTTLPSQALAPAETLPLAEEGSAPSRAAKTKSLSLIADDEASSTASKYPAPPTFGITETAKEKPQRKTSPFLMAAVALVLVAGGVYAYSMFDPSFQGALLSQYNNLQSLVGLAPKPQAVAAVQKPTPAQPAPPATRPPAAAPTTPADSTTAASQPPDGFAQPQSAPMQGFQSSGAPEKSATPVILSTSSTTVQNPAPDAEPSVVPADVADSHVAYRVEPAYPELARRKGVKGNVVLNTNVDKDGNVSAVEVVSGNAQLAAAAAAAVKQWRYEAYYHNGQPTEFQTQVTVRFPASR